MHSLASGGVGNLQVSLPRRYFTSRLTLCSLPKKNDVNRKKVVINISGMVYETYESTLDKYPETLLGTAKKRAALYDRRVQQIYLERHRAAFDAILFFYQSSGYLIRPSNISMDEFEAECNFFDIPENAMMRMKQRDSYLHKSRVIIPGYYTYNNIRYFLWKFIEHPKEWPNSAAMAYSFFSLFLIFASIAVFCVESEVHDELHGTDAKRYFYIQNMIELSLNIYFALELLVRLYAMPQRKRFFKSPINITEITSVALYLFAFGFPNHFLKMYTINVARSLRAFRIARLARVSLMIKTALLVFKSSINDIFAVWFTIFIITIFCGSAMYYIEMKEKNTKFTSIPASMWWGLQTVLCLGYGDIIPTTVMGKIIGSFMLYYGVVVVMVLVLAMGSRFFDMYAKFINMDSFLPEEGQKKADYIVVN